MTASQASGQVRDAAVFAAEPVYQALEETAARYPQHPALYFEGVRLSYADFHRLVNRAARGFQDLGVKPGVHVGLFLGNTPHYAIAFLGVLRAGGTVVNYSPLDAERTLAHKIEDSHSDIMVTLDVPELLPRIRGFLETSRLRTLVVGTPTDFTGEGATGAGPGAAILSFADLLNNEGDFQPYAVADPENTLAVLQYTGGTTGVPKGAELTHGNLTCGCQQLMAALAGDLQTGQERVLAVLPPFHIYSMTVNLLFGIRLAAELYLHSRFDPDAVLKAVHEHRLSVLPAVPTMFIALIHHPQVGEYDLTSLRLCNSGGAPLPVEVQQRFQELTGCRLGEGWGMTETTAVGTYTPLTGERPPQGSCGCLVPGVSMKIAPMDAEGSLAAGERGEICVAGPNVMPRYWNNPDATTASFTEDGYFRTGDVGYMDQRGYVYIVDRTKDMILCSGYNVYPRVIEEAIYEHPDVEEVSVIGVKDSYRGQSPMAFVRLRQSAASLTLESLQDFLADRLGKHEMVRALALRDELPKTPVGKLSKKELYDETASFSL